ncbi:MAG: TPM domain-containing protein [Oscillospiraceae bacterium]|nr:TPM domain-containing protein [Oscillospiraceae bacterium]
MKKRLISLLFVLALCVLTILPAFASSEGFVFDLCDAISDPAVLSDEAEEIYHQSGVALYFIITEDLNGMEAADFVTAFAQEHGFYENSVILLDEPASYYIRATGSVKLRLSDDELNAMMQAYEDETTYTGGIRAYHALGLAYMNTALTLLSGDSSEATDEGTAATENAVTVPGGEETSAHSKRLVDDGELLTAAQEAAIAQRLDEVSEKRQLDLVIVTQKTLGGKNRVAFADDYFDYNGYGFGDDHDGILLLYCPNEGVRYISTTGDAIEIFEGDHFTELTGEIIPYFDRGDYKGAFLAFADACDDIIGSARAFPWGMLVIALLIGAVLSWLIPMSSMKGKLKSVRSQVAASDYVRAGSMSLTQNRDVFLFANVTKTPIPRDTSSRGGGGGTHVGSSGTSHGGGSF